MRNVTLVLLALLPTGCRPLGSLPGDGVTSATLDELNLDSVAVVGGGVGGSAILRWTRPDGLSGEVPVVLRGSSAGLAFAFSGDLNPSRAVALDLSEADPGLTLPDLLGTYRGPAWNVTVGVGGARHHLRNRQGVLLKVGDFTAGLGLSLHYEWLRVSVADDEPLPPVDTGFPDSSGLFFLHTGGTVPLDTGTPATNTTDATDTDATDEEDTGGASGGGCDGCATTGSATGAGLAGLLAVRRRRRAAGR